MDAEQVEVTETRCVDAQASITIDELVQATVRAMISHDKEKSVKSTPSHSEISALVSEFYGAEEDIELWLERVDSVQEVYNILDLRCFETDVEIANIAMNLVFYIVPDSAMAHYCLLGRDFISFPGINVTMGDNLVITKKVDYVYDTEEDNANFLSQIMNIDIDDEISLNESEIMNVNPNLSLISRKQIKEVVSI
ncbi:hypothetical protein RN001_009376 [Aquatica leii]|uniref:Uncharacterized protein n=1 Tax=Aquatica leii TaxID=1421715 RepID=A0AAN7SPW7_9COLE|nr:hypothetical protein RN001_009376 [Aquatica leii]